MQVYLKMQAYAGIWAIDPSSMSNPIAALGKKGERLLVPLLEFNRKAA
jgi:hypothetical protein